MQVSFVSEKLFHPSGFMCLGHVPHCLGARANFKPAPAEGECHDSGLETTRSVRVAE